MYEENETAEPFDAKCWVEAMNAGNFDQVLILELKKLSLDQLQQVVDLMTSGEHE